MNETDKNIYKLKSKVMKKTFTFLMVALLGFALTGSAEGQIALFTFRIKHLTEHMKQNKKDVATMRSLVRLVGKRRRLLDYLKKNDIERYRTIIKELGIRK